DVLLTDAGANLKVERLGLLLDARRLQLLRAQALTDPALRLGLHEALSDLACPRARLPDEFGHGPASSVQGAQTGGQSLGPGPEFSPVNVPVPRPVPETPANVDEDRLRSSPRLAHTPPPERKPK